MTSTHGIREVLRKNPDARFVPPDAKESSLAIALGKKRRSQSGSETERSVPALGYLKDWACTPYDPLKRNPPFFALLGEYGVGKTTCLKELTRQLLDDRAVKPGMPLPLLFDLRNVTVDKGVDAPVPTLEQILQTALNDWKRGTTIANLTPERILQAVQDDGALIIFDGLDEVIVHLTPDRARRFVRELWRLCRPNAATPAATPAR